MHCKKTLNMDHQQSFFRVRAPVSSAAHFQLAHGLSSSLCLMGAGGECCHIIQLSCNTVPGPQLWENQFLGVPTGSQEDYTNQCQCRGQDLSLLWKNVPRKNQGGVFPDGDFFKGNWPSTSAANYIGSLFFEVFISDPKRGRFDSST